MLTNREVLLIKEEVTYRLDPTPAVGANEVLVENPSWANEGLRMIQRAPVRSSLGKLQQVFAGTLEAITFDVEVKGSGVAGTAPEIGPLFEAAGFGETIAPATSVTYAPTSTPSGHKSYTVWYYQDGTLHKLTGCRAQMTGNFTVGERAMLSFTLIGHPDVAVSDVALPTATYNATVPAPYINAPFTVDAFAAVISALSFDIGITLAMPPDVSQVNGYGEIQITDRDVNGSFDPEHELVAVEDFIGNFKSGKAMVMTTGAIGGTAGNICTVNWPVVSYRDTSPADRDGIRTLDLPFGAAESTTDDEISFIFT